VNQFSDERGAEMRELFFETAHELLQTLNEDALKLEKTPKDAEIIRSIRRTVHTLKGDAAACGFSELSEVSHMLEDALAVDVVANTSISLAELAFTAADVFSAMLSAYHQQGPLPDTGSLKAMVRELASDAGAVGGTGKTGDLTQVVWTEYEKLSAETSRAQGKKIFHVIAHVDPMCGMPIAARQLVANALGAIAEILGARPEPGFHGNTKVLDLLIATSATQDEVVAKCRIPTVISRAECFEASTSGSQSENIGNMPGSPEAVPTSEDFGESTAVEAGMPGTPRPGHAADSILRVDAERIDSVLNLVGELIIGKSMLQQAVNEFIGRYPKDALRARFADAMGFQSRVLNDLQRSVMKVRMVPVEQLFRRFPRMVRDAAKRCDKNAQLVVSGQNTDLDKTLLDAIAEPLTHIVRNAISHGLESPAEREKAGKPATGTIRLDAYHQGSQLIVQVSDDGRGIDFAKVKAKAIKAHLISPEEAEDMSAADILDLIFRPGFSTADEITEISGRGVGLDVVRSVLHRLKGTVELETHPGQGSQFRLKLPLTLSIIKALLFRVQHRLYAIPLNSVAELARARESDLHLVDCCEVLQLRGDALPLVRLGQKPAEDHNRQGKIFVLVITFGDRKMGLIVDAMEGEEELVIKALDDQTVATDLVSGASILGDGRVVLILNLAAIRDRFTRRAADVTHSGLLLSDWERRAVPAAEVQQ
jgi:two-component system, chemotaxis family, sensor kinase CheA